MTPDELRDELWRLNDEAGKAALATPPPLTEL
jgi:hypothetical protein